jgi:hypothetical protein
MGGLGTEIVDLAADEGGHAKELTDVKGFWASLGQFVFDSGQMAGQAAQLLFMRGEDSLVEGFGFESLKFLDLVVALVVPVNETAFGDADVSGDARKAPALGAEFDELIFGFGGMHTGDGLVDYWIGGLVDWWIEGGGRDCGSWILDAGYSMLVLAARGRKARKQGKIIGANSCDLSDRFGFSFLNFCLYQVTA